MKIDWQAYLDNSLATEEQQVAERLLQESPEARRELEGLKTFVSDVRQAALSEEVPLDRLMALMPSEKPEPAVRQTRSWLRLAPISGLAVAATLVVVVVMGVVRNYKPALTLTATEGYVTDTSFASQWASKKLAMNVPDMNLGPDARLTFAHEGNGRCCFDFVFQGEKFHMNVRPKRKLAANPGKPILLKNGQRAYYGRGVRWIQGDYELSIAGGKRENALELANRATLVLHRV